MMLYAEVALNHLRAETKGFFNQQKRLVLDVSERHEYPRREY